MSEEALTVEQVAQKLHLDERTVRRYFREGRIPAVKVGKRWLATQSTLDGILRGEIKLEVVNA